MLLVKDKFVVASWFQLIASMGIALRHYSFFLPDSPIKNFLASVNFVEFFFCCSGFFLYRSYCSVPFNFFSFVGKWLVRIYPAHFITTLFFIVVLSAKSLGVYEGHTQGNVYQFSDLAPVLFLLHSLGLTSPNPFNYPSWYLSAQFFMYLIFFPVLCFLRSSNFWRVLNIICVVLLSIIVLEYFTLARGTHWTSWTYDYGVFRAVPSFLAGMVLAYFFGMLGDWRIPAYSPFFCLVVCLLAFSLEGFHVFVYFVLQIALLATLVFARRNINLGRIPDRLFGINVSDLSFGVYVFHVPVASVFMTYVHRRLFGDGGDWVWVFIGLTLTISFVVSIVWFRFVLPWFERWVSGFLVTFREK